MSYRDELAQAHARIAQLEGKLQDHEGGAPKAMRATSGRLMGGVAGGALFALVLAGAGTYWAARPVRAVELRPVNEVMRAQTHYRGVPMRVRGQIVVGSFVRMADQQGACLQKFVLQNDLVQMHVETTQCVLPDRFTDQREIQVVAEGELGGNGVFQASAVLVRAGY
jgi:cytochrome c-type biogenesis protein CcmE